MDVGPVDGRVEPVERVASRLRAPAAARRQLAEELEPLDARGRLEAGLGRSELLRDGLARALAPLLRAVRLGKKERQPEWQQKLQQKRQPEWQQLLGYSLL